MWSFKLKHQILFLYNVDKCCIKFEVLFITKYEHFGSFNFFKCKWPTQKNLIFQLRQFSIFLMIFLWFGPWISRIDWCEGHWFGLTFMVVRMSDIGSKTGKKCVFCVFRLVLSLCQTASKPYRLSHTNALCINQFYKPKDQSIKFSWKNIKNWRSWKMSFFWVGYFEFFESTILIFFASYQWKMQPAHMSYHLFLLYGSL